LKGGIELQLDQTSFFTLEGKITVYASRDSVSVSGTIARLGEYDAQDLFINYIVLVTDALPHQRYIAVKNIRDNIYINSLAAGKTKPLPDRTAVLDRALPDITRVSLLIILKDEYDQVLQSVLIKGDQG
jgi:hypothetical protein